MKILETHRLLLKSWSEDKLEDMYEYAKDPQVGPMAGWKPHESREETLEILKHFSEGEEVWAVIYKENGKAIGSIGLHGDDKRGDTNCKMLGYVLAREYWGKGLMTEAARRVIAYGFEEEYLDLISCYHYPHNDKSKRVIEKCGFTYEGTLRKATKIYDGSIYDDCLYSITKEEYHKVKHS